MPIIIRARETAFFRSATQFADISAYGKGETAALKFGGALEKCRCEGKTVRVSPKISAFRSRQPGEKCEK